MKDIREVEGRMRLGCRRRSCKEEVTQYRSGGRVKVTANVLLSPQTRFGHVGRAGSVITNESTSSQNFTSQNLIAITYFL